MHRIIAKRTNRTQLAPSRTFHIPVLACRAERTSWSTRCVSVQARSAVPARPPSLFLRCVGASRALRTRRLTKRLRILTHIAQRDGGCPTLIHKGPRKAWLTHRAAGIRCVVPHRTLRALRSIGGVAVRASGAHLAGAARHVHASATLAITIAKHAWRWSHVPIKHRHAGPLAAEHPLCDFLWLLRCVMLSMFVIAGCVMWCVSLELCAVIKSVGVGVLLRVGVVQRCLRSCTSKVQRQHAHTR